MFIYFWLCSVFVSMCGLSLVAVSRDLLLFRLVSLRSTGSKRASSVVMAHEPTCSAACGIFSGLESMFPALADRFSTTALQEKAQLKCFYAFHSAQLVSSIIKHQLLGESVHAVPHYHKLCSRVSPIWGNHRRQHTRIAMSEPRPGKTTFMIMVSPLPGKYI